MKHVLKNINSTVAAIIFVIVCTAFMTLISMTSHTSARHEVERRGYHVTKIEYRLYGCMNGKGSGRIAWRVKTAEGLTLKVCVGGMLPPSVQPY